MTTIPAATDFQYLSTKGLQAITGILTGKPITRNASKAIAAARVVRLLAADADAAASLDNLPSLLRSRGFGEDADKLEAGVATAAAQEAAGGEVDDRDFGVGPTDETADLADYATPEEIEEAIREDVEAESASRNPTVTDHQEEVKVAVVRDRSGRRVKGSAKAAKEAKAEAKAKAASAPPPAKGEAKPGSVHGRSIALLERPEGLGQAEIVAKFGRKYSAAYRAKFLAAKYGRVSSVEGEGKARIFRLSKTDTMATGADIAA